MSVWLLKLLGVRAEDVAHVSRMSLELTGGLPIGWVILSGIILTAIVAWIYLKAGPQVSSWRRFTMMGLRFLLIWLILVLLLRPTLEFVIQGSIRRSVLVMFDDSASMTIGDPRTESGDRMRVAVAKNRVDPAKGLDQKIDSEDKTPLDHVSRVEVAKSAMKNERLELLQAISKNFDLRFFSFGQAVADMTPPPAEEGAYLDFWGWLDRLKSASPATALGDGVRDVLNRWRGQPVAGIVLITDGAGNSGSDPHAAAKMAKGQSVPLYVYGVGISSPKDVILSNLFAPSVAFVNDEVNVTARVRGQGLEGQSGKLVLKLGDEKVDEKQIEYGAGAEQVIAMKFTPTKPGEFNLSAGIEPREDEVSKDNNSVSQRLKVVDGKIKILYVEQSPRWEFRYLQALLMRDRRVDFKCVLQEADASMANDEKSPYLAQIPSKREDLFKYDLIIIGDVDPRTFTGTQLQNIGEFVSKFGGGFLMLAGRRYSPAAYRWTVIEKMLPVELGEGEGNGAGPGGWRAPRANGGAKPTREGVSNDEIHLELTAAGKRSPMLRLADDEVSSTMRWVGLPPIFWTAKVARAKPAAEVMVVDPDPSKASRGQKMPVIATQQYGLGQVAYIGTDNTWRWRRNNGESAHAALWGQIVQRLSLPHLLGESKRTQLATDRAQYATGERVTLFARLYTESYEPVIESSVKGSYKSDAGAQGQVQLRAMPEQPGLYRGEFIAPEAGAYQFHVEQDDKTRLDFVVTPPKLELSDTAMNEPLLREMAKVSGGAFFREEDLYKLPEQIGGKTEQVESKLGVELWSTPAYFLMMLMVATAEWVLRKFSQLK